MREQKKIPPEIAALDAEWQEAYNSLTHEIKYCLERAERAKQKRLEVNCDHGLARDALAKRLNYSDE